MCLACDLTVSGAMTLLKLAAQTRVESVSRALSLGII